MPDLILPESEVNELLGVVAQPSTVGPALDVSVNIGVLNALGKRWVHAGDLERALLVFAGKEPSDRVAKMLRDLANVVTGKV